MISMWLNPHVDKVHMWISFHRDVAFFNFVWINGRRINLMWKIQCTNNSSDLLKMSSSHHVESQTNSVKGCQRPPLEPIGSNLCFDF